MANLTVNSSTRDGAVIVQLDGAASVDQIDHMQMQFMRITAQHPKRVVIDMANLSFLASLGMGLLVAINRDIARQGGKVKLAGVGPLVLEALQRARLDALLELHATVDEALA
ncbi:MAG: STAS domain-containing protein [Phycisphaeraceae bacterium]